jgi:RNA polymerase sigma-70 factor, ECF subfamily
MTCLSDLQLDESVLIVKALQGDREALNTLFSRYYAFLHGLACHVLGGREDAEDVVQNSLIRALGSLQQFNNAGAFRSWLSRILVNEAIDLLRKKRSKKNFSDAPASRREESEVLDLLPTPELNPEQAFFKKESIRVLEREVARLSAPLRSAVMLCGLREYSTEEAGKVLSVPESTVRARLFRARKQLATAIRSNEWPLLAEKESSCV